MASAQLNLVVASTPLMLKLLPQMLALTSQQVNEAQFQYSLLYPNKVIFTPGPFLFPEVQNRNGTESQ